MKTIFFFLSCMFATTLGFSNHQTVAPDTCPAPANVSLVSQTDSTITFDWDDCGCSPSEYRVYYKRGSETSSEFTTGSSEITFAGLASGNYEFYFYTACGGPMSAIILEEVLVI